MIPRPAAPRLIAPRRTYDTTQRVHLRQRGRWFHVDYMFQGKRRRKSLETDNMKIAQRMRTELEYRLQARLLKDPVDIRLEELLEEYAHNVESKLARKSVKTQLGYLRRFSAKFPQVRLSEIMPSIIEGFMLTVNGGKPSPKTWNNVRGYFGTMLEFAKKHGYLAESVIDKVERRPEVQRTIRFIESKREIEGLLTLFDGHSLQPLVATLLYAGLRRSEAVWLTWNDVDLERGLIHIREKTVDGQRWWPKTKRNRNVPIVKLVDIFKRLPRTSQWVFPSPEGKRWNPDNLSRAYRSVVRRAGLPWTLLDLRHTFASQLAMRDVSIDKIAKFMGNSPVICERHYAAIIPERLHSDVEY